MYKMLIPYDTVSQILSSYGITVNGVLHIGAHECEELAAYTQNGVNPDNIIWIEANPSLVEKMRAAGTPVYNAAISNKEEEVPFYITNNGQSSSLLKFGTHAQHYPWCVVSNTITVKTETLQTFIDKHKIHIGNYNFWNLDIQGCELSALISAGDNIMSADAIYCEVNIEEVYEGCALLTDLDTYLSKYNFTRHSISMTGAGWGDALYIKT
jgi:FkbM family methyltransferase